MIPKNKQSKIGIQGVSIMIDMNKLYNQLNILPEKTTKYFCLSNVRNYVRVLNALRQKYYNENKSIVTDMEYDELFDKLKELEDYTGIHLSNSPTNTVGYQVVSGLPKVKHIHPLLSLDKTTDIEKFYNYFEGKPAVIMTKMDGLTCELTYYSGKLIRAETRGNGEVGEDITHNAVMFSNIPLTIPFKGDLVVTGECIIDADTFSKINAVEQTEYKNPRNLVSGTVRQLDNSVVDKRNVKFIAWRLHSKDKIEPNNFISSIEYLNSIGFETVICGLVETKEQCEMIIEYIRSICDEKGYPYDGIVGSFNDMEYGRSLGITGHHPKHSYAFKFQQEQNETKLLEIEWAVTRSGQVNPVAIFEPIEIDGTTVSRATLCNSDMIKELKIGIGDTLTIIKANAIIPQITDNLTKSNTYKIPDYCPCCGFKLRKDGAFLKCDNPNCKDKLIDTIRHFASRDGMNIIGVSVEKIKTLVEMGYLNSVSDLYMLKPYTRELCGIDGWGTNSVENLINSIENSRNCKIENLIYALGIDGIGKSAAKTISKHIATQINSSTEISTNNPMIYFVQAAMNKYDWSKLKDIGETTSNNINEYVIRIKNVIYELKDELNIELPTVSNNTALDGKTFCITGKLKIYTNRYSISEDIEKHGGFVVSSVTAKTDYLVTNDRTTGSSKLQKALKYGTTIITEQELCKMLA